LPIVNFTSIFMLIIYFSVIKLLGLVRTITFPSLSPYVSKVKQSRYTPWRRLGGEEVQLLLIHDLGTRWGWVVSITPRPRFTPEERTPGTHCTGGWVGPRAGLDTEARGKILCPCRGSNPDRPVVQPVVRHYTAWATRLTESLCTLYFTLVKSTLEYAPVVSSSITTTDANKLDRIQQKFAALCYNRLLPPMFITVMRTLLSI
jgi:hypothetical protein